MESGRVVVRNLVHVGVRASRLHRREGRVDERTDQQAVCMHVGCVGLPVRCVEHLDADTLRVRLGGLGAQRVDESERQGVTRLHLDGRTGEGARR